MAPKCEPLCQFSDRLFYTTFPQPAPSPAVLNKLASELGNTPLVRARTRAGTSSLVEQDASYYYFTIDDQLLYFSFAQDWGPLNLAMVYKACILIHELLEDKDLAPHRLVLYSSNDPRRKANSALLMALYVLIVQRRAPWEAFNPIAELEFMPFRDAGRGPSDFNLNIQDCLWGIWKAMHNGLCDMNEFDVEDYEYYEKVENGDWNWLTPNFIAFASPLDTNYVKREKEARESLPSQSPLASSTSSNHALQRKLPTPFLNCLDYFEKNNIRLVIRLNNQLYDRNTFVERGIDHMEMYFDDGTNPTDEIVRLFIDTVDKVIEEGGVVAVHCKAGLGRTGTLIGAYMIWKYGFTANEAIAFMRIVRPGSVVGPQQQYMYLKQLEWCKWSASDEIRKAQKADASADSTTTPAVVTPATPPAEADEERMMTTPPPTVVTLPLPPVTPSRHVAAAAAKAKAIAPPGQPRKTPKGKRVAPVDSDEEGELDDVLPQMVPLKKVAKTATSTRPGAVRASADKSKSEVRPTRMTRSAASARTAPTIPVSPTKPTASSSKPRPNKIPRLAVTKVAAGGKVSTLKSLHNSTESDSSIAPGPASLRRPPASPIPSRLPTLRSKVVAGNPTSLNEVAKSAARGGKPAGQTTSDAWMTTNAANAVVVPASKAGSRPGLRNVRRRRSSFSNADVVA